MGTCAIFFYFDHFSNNHHYRLSLFAFQNDFKIVMLCTEGIIYVRTFLYPKGVTVFSTLPHVSWIMSSQKEAVIILLKGR